VLNREKLAQDLSSILGRLFPDLKLEQNLAKKMWEEIASDGTFLHRADGAKSSFLVPRWEGRLDDVFEVKRLTENYSVLAVDGSQIYPDRHVSGAGCFLINTGGLFLEYGEMSKTTFFSEPSLMIPSEVVQGIGAVGFSRELVDLKREEYELTAAVEKSKKFLSENKSMDACLIDGSIIFWQLESKPQEIKDFFLNKYLTCLDYFYKKKIVIAGYISMSKSRELVNLIKLGLCRFAVADCIACHSLNDSFPCKQVDNMVDTQVASFFLRKGEGKKFRTTVFYSGSKIVELYPEHLRPAFVYCDVGSEIVRLEFPAWIAQDKNMIDRLCSIAYDQSEKGRGYPVCLAEAHEQAVVKGADREFFYHLLCKIAIEGERRIRFSEKAIKKRGLGV